MSGSAPSTPSKTPWGTVLLASAPAALHALLLLGRIHPDEVFQSLEPAMHRAFGFGVLAWEWQVGLRNYAVVILFSSLLKAAAAVGLNSVFARRLVLEVPQFALHAAMMASVYRFAARRVGHHQARVSIVLMGLYAPLMWFGGRTMSESFSTAFLVWGLERLDARDDRWHVPLLSGVLLGLAEMTRYGSAAVIAPAMLFLLFTRRFRAFAYATLGGAVMAVCLGALDLYSWGDWFHSFRAYVNFNVLTPQAAAQFGASPWWLYVIRFIIAPWAPIGLAAWYRQPSQRSWLFVVSALGYFAIITATAHKEERFLYPTLILLSVAATPAFVSWAFERWSRPVTKGVVAVVAAASAAFFVIPSPIEPKRKEQFQLELKASREATGFVLMNDGVWGSGGFFYLGQNLPWCPCDFPTDPCFQMAAKDHRFNRAVYWGAEGDPQRDLSTSQAFDAAGFKVLERRGNATLFGR